MKIGIKILICAFFLLIGVLIGVNLRISYSIEIATYILIGANILMIFLMLGTILYMGKSTREHINAVKVSSIEQINTMRRWSNIKRKQLIKSLIEEIKHNIIVYNQLIEKSKKKEYSQQFFNFIFVSMEKCLSDSPIEKEDINHNILVMYYLIKIHDIKISGTRTPNIRKDSLKGLIDSIIKDYKEDKWLFESTVEMLKEYEKNIKI